MANIALNMEPLDELRLITEPEADRLPAMLFLAALVHGILIIGVTFNPALLDEFSDAISLEVTIVADPDQEIDRPDRAEYLAQASQEGGGNTTDQVRPSAPPENTSPIDNPGDEFGDSFLESNEHIVSADQLLATATEQEQNVTDDPRIDPQPETSTALALEAGSDTTLPLPQDDLATLLIHDDDPAPAGYQCGYSRISGRSPTSITGNAASRPWATSIFPNLGDLDGLTGSPTLEVSIDANGATRRGHHPQVQRLAGSSTRPHSTYCGARHRSIRSLRKFVPTTTACGSRTSGCSARNLCPPLRERRATVDKAGPRRRLYGHSAGRILSAWRPPDRWPSQLLIAMPGMADPNFSSTVTLICEHNDEGALGIVINRPLTMKLAGLFEQLDLDRRRPRYCGESGAHGRTGRS